MLPAGARVIVAVSGGADSVCLLHVLKELAPDFARRHRPLQSQMEIPRPPTKTNNSSPPSPPASALPFFRAEATSSPGNREQEARRARQKFFATLDATVALGHTRDDQAETVLFRFLSGSGLAGLSGIAPIANGIIRPLIEITRAEIEQFLRSRKIQWREDSTNQDLSFARNRIRHELLPQLARDWNPNIATP